MPGRAARADGDRGLFAQAFDHLVEALSDPSHRSRLAQPGASYEDLVAVLGA